MPNVYGPTSSVDTVTDELVRYANTNCVQTGSLSVIQTQPRVRSFISDYAIGHDVPGWRKMRNAGHLLPMTAWKRTHFEFECQLGHRDWCSSPTARRNYWNNYYDGYDPNFMSETYFMSLVGPLDLQYYVQKAAAGIASSGWDALTFLAEIRQLRRMFAGVVDKLGSLARGLPPGRAHDLWLEGRYGWRTLTYDIRDLHEVLTKANDRRTRYRESKGFTHSDFVHQTSQTTASNIIGDNIRDISWTVNLRGTVVADIDVPDLRFNPITTAWEVTKLSFVVDWLWNVGQALDAASFLLMAKAYRACAGYKVDIDYNGSTSLAGTTGSTVCHAFDISYQGKATIIERIPSSISVIPQVKLRLDQWKVLDIFSLILQRL